MVWYAACLYHGMTTTFIEPTKQTQMPCCTREQAARLLKELRAEYQDLWSEERAEVKSHFSRLADAQSCLEESEY